MAKAAQDGDLMFQMFDYTWGFYYGVERNSEYLNKYFSQNPLVLKNVFSVLNSTTYLASGDLWREFVAVQYGNDPEEYFVARITYADTSLQSNSTFGFACPEDYSESDEYSTNNRKDSGCLLTQLPIEYPEFPI